MRVFMLGWEFPPFISGGLGTACYGLTKAMSSIGTDIMFVLPRPVSSPFSTHVRLVSPRPGSPLASPTPARYEAEKEKSGNKKVQASRHSEEEAAAAALPPPPLNASQGFIGSSSP